MMEAREDDLRWNAQLRVFHPGTFNANPVASATGSTALGLIGRGGEVERAAERTAQLVRGINRVFEEHSVPGSAWALQSMWHMNLGYEAPRPSDVEWDAEEQPRGVDRPLSRPLKQALFNHGVDLMGTGGMVSSAHTEADIDHTIDAFGRAIDDLRNEGLLN